MAKSHENISDCVDSLVGSQTHKVSDGTYTGYGSSRRLAERAYDDAKDQGREYIDYNVEPEDCWFGFWNHHGPQVEEKSDDDKGSNCFLSTACLTARNLPDNCTELQVLRKFRDEYVLSQAQGPELVATYYSLAPRVVRAIHARPDAREIYESIYAELVRPCVDLIAAERFEDALKRYRRITQNLCRRFLTSDYTEPGTLVTAK